MQSGDTLLAVDGTDDHLWIIISDTDTDPDELVIVCLLSWQEYHDQACILHPGDHPFVKHDTCVNYPSATLAHRTKLESLLKAGNLKAKAPVSAELLGRIRMAVSESDIPSKCHKKLFDQGLVEY